ncbi:hypothetical protein CDAR_14581 [Caerostris darwini]|uniref:Uncharacterized protein n=1 Tax=Caerostris darwini TaxID=1538125 RepID=A0AAV4RC27_9ARAC|nr:hypothetical protein CDAR_14581 [Caerostris darwini]
MNTSHIERNMRVKDPFKQRLCRRGGIDYPSPKIQWIIYNILTPRINFQLPNPIKATQNSLSHCLSTCPYFQYIYCPYHKIHQHGLFLPYHNP